MRLKNIQPLTESLNDLRISVTDYTLRISEISFDFDRNIPRYESRAESAAYRKFGAEKTKEIDRQHRIESRALVEKQEQEIRELAIAFYNLIQAKAVLYSEQRKELIDKSYGTEE